jgi:hypothetical protein
MSAVDKAYKQVYSSKTPTSRIVAGRLDASNRNFFFSEFTDRNWIIVGNTPISAEELGGEEYSK